MAGPGRSLITSPQRFTLRVALNMQPFKKSYLAVLSSVWSPLMSYTSRKNKVLKQGYVALTSTMPFKVVYGGSKRYVKIWCNGNDRRTSFCYRPR